MVFRSGVLEKRERPSPVIPEFRLTARILAVNFLFGSLKKVHIYMNDAVKSADRILDILEYFSLRDETLALREISRKLMIPKSSALMLLRNLESRGYLLREGGQGYRLAPALRAGVGGWVGGAISSLARASMPVMRELVESLRETVVLGVLTAENQVRVVRSIVGPQVIRYELKDEDDLPAYCTGMGLSILAHSAPERVTRFLAEVALVARTQATITEPEALLARLELIRRDGYSTNIDERIAGASGAAAAIFGPRDTVLGALNIGTVTFRLIQNRDEIVAAVRDGAARISRQLGGKIPGESSTWEPRTGTMR